MSLDETTAGIDLTGLTPAPAQQWGAIRMIPLLCTGSPGDLRLQPRKVDAAAVKLNDGTADPLASAFVVPHPDDYRQLHRSLLGDFYGELLFQYGLLYREVQSFDLELDAATITSLTDLRTAVEAGRRLWHEHSALMSRGLLERTTRWQTVYRAGPFHLRRFIRCAGALGDTVHGLLVRLRNAGFGYLLRPHIVRGL